MLTELGFTMWGAGFLGIAYSHGRVAGWEVWKPRWWTELMARSGFSGEFLFSHSRR